MEETLLRTGQRDLVDDECSTDSGCSSGGSTESAEASSRRGSAERRYTRGRSAGRQERLRQRADGKPARSWSPLKREPAEDRQAAPAATSEPRTSATARGLRKAFQTFRISAQLPGGPEKAAPKKSQKRILRSPVAYTYVKGLSGLPTQRIPRNAV